MRSSPLVGALGVGIGISGAMGGHAFIAGFGFAFAFAVLVDLLEDILSELESMR